MQKYSRLEQHIWIKTHRKQIKREVCRGKWPESSHVQHAQLKADCPNGPMLRVTDKRAVIYKPWNLNFKDRVQCTLNTAVGINRKGELRPILP